MKKLKILIIGLLACQFTIAQSNFLSGKIIATNGDTINAFIDYRGWIKNPHFINVKNNLNEESIVKKTSDILEFRVKDEIYVSAIVEVALNDTELANSEGNPNVKTSTDTVFLQTLFRGEKSLFFYKGKNRADSYYIQTKNGYELLMYKKYTAKVQGQRQTKENKEYVNQLNKYLKGCPDLFEEAKKIGYTEKYLINLFENYYSCSNEEVLFKREAKKAKKEFGLIGGVSFTKLFFEGKVFDHLINPSFDLSIDPSFGLFLDFVFPRSQGKWSIYNEFLVTNYSTESEYEEIISNNHSISSVSKIGYTYFNLNNMVQFKYPIGSVFLFANLGISNGVVIRTINSREAERLLSNEITKTIEPAVRSTRNHEQSVIAGTGLKYNDFTFTLRLERGNGMSNINSLKSTTMRYYFLTAYRF